jgi:hypothetical protein
VTPERQPLSDNFDIWTLGVVATVMPALRATDPPPLRDAMTRRAAANLTGRCPTCQAATDVAPIAPRKATGAMTHEPTCDLADEPFGALLAASRGTPPIAHGHGRPQSDPKE